ncbi:hypothetical protein GCM10028825_18890 [Spirosoma agri]|nr:hypothetical protein [Spirosoma agri]
MRQIAHLVAEWFWLVGQFAVDTRTAERGIRKLISQHLGGSVILYMEEQLLPTSVTPEWFEYPESVLVLLKLGLLNIKPWKVLTGEQLLAYNSRYAQKQIVPFAIRLDNDDIVCWSLKHDKKLVLWDETEMGFKSDEVYKDVWAWLTVATQDMIDFHS